MEKAKDCTFLLADGQMAQAIYGFLNRDKFHLSLGTRAFTYPLKPIVPPRTYGGDAGIFKHGHNFLRGARHEYKHAIAILDHQWEGAPSPDFIQRDLKQRIVDTGWRSENVEVIVIVPELEVWLCQSSPHVLDAFGFDCAPHASLRHWCEAEGFWRPTELKPAFPKEAFEKIQLLSSKPRSGATYAEITRKISPRGCTDPAFCLLRETLQRWFPNDGGTQ